MVTKDLLKKVKQVQIKTKRMVTDVLAGEYRSSFKGKGMEFEEVREYLPGDEIRTIDWNVTARTGIPHIKNFREERELVVMLVVDVSASSEYGTVGVLKKDVAVEMCSVLAFSAINNNDKVGLILFSDRIEKVVPPRKGKKHVLRVIRELLATIEAVQSKINRRFAIGERLIAGVKNLFGLKRTIKRRKTDISTALDYLNRMIKKRSIVFLVSDFMDTGYHEKIKLTNKKHDLVTFLIKDPTENKLPRLPAVIEIEDLETGERRLVDMKDDKVRDQYMKLMSEKDRTRDRFFKSNSIDSVSIDISKPYVNELIKLFKLRESRR